MGKNIVLKFSKIEKGRSLCITNYSDFLYAKKGDFLGFIMKDVKDNLKNSCTAFFEKRIVKNNEQRIFLQMSDKTNKRFYDTDKPVVVEYNLPLKGELNLSYFKEHQGKVYRVE